MMFAVNLNAAMWCAGVYFAASAFVCAVCFLLYACVLPKLPFVQYHRKRSKSSLQPYIMEAIPPRPAVEEQDRRASSHSKVEPDTDAELHDQEVCGCFPTKAHKMCLLTTLT